MPVLFGRPVQLVTMTSVAGVVAALTAFVANIKTIVDWDFKPKTAETAPVVEHPYVQPPTAQGLVSPTPPPVVVMTDSSSAALTTGAVTPTPLVRSQRIPETTQPSDEEKAASMKLTTDVAATPQAPYQPAQDLPAKLELPNEAKH